VRLKRRPSTTPGVEHGASSRRAMLRGAAIYFHRDAHKAYPERRSVAALVTFSRLRCSRAITDLSRGYLWRLRMN
jgi:hypothetical protein